MRRIPEQPAPVPDEMATSDDMNLYQKLCAGYNACRNAMLNAEPLRAIEPRQHLVSANKNAYAAYHTK